MICLYGEVAGIYEKGGTSFIKLHYESGFVDLALSDVSDIYLGDKIIIHSDLTIKKILTQPEENEHNQ